MSPSELRANSDYLHVNGVFVRRITAIKGDDVYWQDKVARATGVIERTSRKTFCKQVQGVVGDCGATYAPAKQKRFNRLTLQEIASNAGIVKDTLIRLEPLTIDEPLFGAEIWCLKGALRRSVKYAETLSEPGANRIRVATDLDNNLAIAQSGVLDLQTKLGTSSPCPAHLAGMPLTACLIAINTLRRLLAPKLNVAPFSE
jgi:hypothetical protein